MVKGRMSGPAAVCALVAAVLFAVLPVVPFTGAPALAAEKPTVTLSKSQAGTGGSLTVTGSGIVI